MIYCKLKNVRYRVLNLSDSVVIWLYYIENNNFYIVGEDRISRNADQKVLHSVDINFIEELYELTHL